MTGKIMKGIGGFYYVYVEGSGLYECRARGIFRNKKMKPNVGDVVDIDILSEEEKYAILKENAICVNILPVFPFNLFVNTNLGLSPIYSSKFNSLAYFFIVL